MIVTKNVHSISVIKFTKNILQYRAYSYIDKSNLCDFLINEFNIIYEPIKILPERYKSSLCYLQSQWRLALSFYFNYDPTSKKYFPKTKLGFTSLKVIARIDNFKLYKIELWELSLKDKHFLSQLNPLYEYFCSLIITTFVQRAFTGFTDCFDILSDFESFSNKLRCIKLVISII